MSVDESGYLIEGLAHQFPALNLAPADALSSFSAVRPVIAGGKADPSAESRESATWSEPGLVGLAGGKLTTFRRAARQLLEEAAKQQPALAPRAGAHSVWARPPGVEALRVSARDEFVVNLDDLLLRRSRAGLLERDGARALLPQVKSVCQAELGWTEDQWSAQQTRYLELWREDHAPVRA